MSTYDCQIHKIQYESPKRNTFREEFYDLLLKVPMNLSMKLYKDVNVSCDCPSNYAAFDSILKDARLSGTIKDS
jgi:hypothetical protein